MKFHLSGVKMHLNFVIYKVSQNGRVCICTRGVFKVEIMPTFSSVYQSILDHLQSIGIVRNGIRQEIESLVTKGVLPGTIDDLYFLNISIGFEFTLKKIFERIFSTKKQFRFADIFGQSPSGKNVDINCETGSMFHSLHLELAERCPQERVDGLQKSAHQFGGCSIRLERGNSAGGDSAGGDSARMLQHSDFFTGPIEQQGEHQEPCKYDGRCYRRNCQYRHILQQQPVERLSRPLPTCGHSTCFKLHAMNAGRGFSAAFVYEYTEQESKRKLQLFLCGQEAGELKFCSGYMEPQDAGCYCAMILREMFEEYCIEMTMAELEQRVIQPYNHMHRTTPIFLLNLSGLKLSRLKINSEISRRFSLPRQFGPEFREVSKVAWVTTDTCQVYDPQPGTATQCSQFMLSVTRELNEIRIQKGFLKF